MAQATSSTILELDCRAPSRRYVGPGLYLLSTHNGPKRYWIESSSNPGLGDGWLSVRPDRPAREVREVLDIDSAYLKPMIIARYK
jgi:hypothetical protein